ncbi:hypothetical protein K8I31_09125 [bacterium]|nr:hypothetical protein [bacterium]
MNNSMRANVLSGVLLAGAAASCLNWKLALPLIALWAMLFCLRWLSYEMLTRIVTTLAVAQSLYCVMIVCLPSVPLAACLACGALLVLASLIFLFKKSISQWALIGCLSGFILLFASGVHYILNAMLDKPFDGYAWTSVAWAALAFSFSFALVNQQSALASIKKWAYSFPVLIVLVIAAHSLQAQRLEFRLSSESKPGALAQIAFDKGYDELGVCGALLESERLLATQSLGDAVRYARQQWKYADKTRFLSQYKHPLLKSVRPSHFYLDVCYGVQLQFNKNEFVIDGAVCDNSQTIYVVTSQNRLFAFSRAIQQIPVPIADAKALHASAYGISILCASEVVVASNDSQVDVFSMKDAGIAKDVSLSQDGQRCFILLGTGRVDEYARDENKQWGFAQTRYKALWKEPDAAVALRMTDKGGAYILTKNGGVHYHDATVYNRELSPFWDPDRADMRDFAREPQSNQLLLMDDFGRLDFIDLNHVPTAGRPVAAGWPSVPAEIQFDRDNAVWSGKPNRVAVEVVPGADTALQFFRNGFIQAIALPQCARVRYRRGEMKRNLSDNQPYTVIE